MSYNLSNYSKECSKGPYSLVTESIWDTSISTHAKTVYIYLTSNDEGFHPSKSEIARRTGMTHRTVITALNTLKKYNMIKIYSTGSNTIDRFKILSIKEWTVPKLEDKAKLKADMVFEEIIKKDKYVKNIDSNKGKFLSIDLSSCNSNTYEN